MSHQKGQTVPTMVSVPFIDDGILPPMPPSPRPLPHISNADMDRMTPKQLNLYLTSLIAREWKKTATALYPSRNTVVADLMLSDKEIAVCHVKFRCDEVPAHVVDKVRYLAEKGEEGDSFTKFMAFLRNEVRMVTFEDDVNSPKIDKYKGVSGAVAMLAELAVFRVQLDVDWAVNDDFSNKVAFKVALVCGRGYTYTYTFSTRLDAKFAVVMQDLNNRFPSRCNPRCELMVSRWHAHVKDLKETGMVGHPRLAVVERLIQEHINAPHEMFDEWMYVHELSNRGDRIPGEEQFKALMQWAAGSIDHQPKGCLMRVMEAKMREIFTALRTIDEDRDRLRRRNQPPRFFTTPPKASTRSDSDEGLEEKKTPRSDGKNNSGKRKANASAQSGENGNMPWDLDDLKTLGFEKEGTDTPTKKKKQQQRVSSSNRSPIVENERATREFPRNQTIYPS